MRKKGFTLIEIIVCLSLVTIIGVFSFFGVRLVNNNIRINKLSQITDKAIQAAQVYIETNKEASSQLYREKNGVVVPLNVLVNEGFIASYDEVKLENNQSVLKVTLKYTDTKERVIKGLKRVSKPGLRVYAQVDELPRVLNGLGIAIISTSHGVMTDREARKANIGGEVLAYVW